MSFAAVKVKPKQNSRSTSSERTTLSADNILSFHNSHQSSPPQLSSFYSCGPAVGLSTLVQAKISIGQTGDPYEQEADTAADRVVQGAAVPEISTISPHGLSGIPQRKNSDQNEETDVQLHLIQRSSVKPEFQAPTIQQQADEDEIEEPVQTTLIQHQIQEEEEEETLQTSGEVSTAGPSTPSTAVVESAIQSVGPGSTMNSGTRHRIESSVGQDLSNVRVHEDGSAHRANTALKSRAFTHGNNIWLGQGESQNDLRLMAHETTHVLQQDGVVRRSPLDEEGATGETARLPAAASSETPAEVPAVSRGAEALLEVTPSERLPQVEPSAVAGGRASAPLDEAMPVVAPTTDLGGEGGLGAELLMPEPPSELSDGAQARLEEAQRNAGSVTAEEEALPTADASTSDARGAVQEPREEVAGRAESGLMSALQERPAPSPEIQELCDRIREVIRRRRPPDEDSLVEAQPEQMAREAGGELNDSVEGDTERVEGSYDQIDNPPEGQPQREAQEFEEPPESVETSSINAEQAVPDEVPAENVSLDADVEASQARMDEAGMSSDAAELVQDSSNPVVEARSAQGELQETAERDPTEVLARQQEDRAHASEDMAGLQQRALEALNASRRETVGANVSRQHNMVGSEEQTRTQVSAEAQRIYREAQTQVNNLLEPLTRTAMNRWETGVGVLAERFRQRLRRVEQWIEERHSGVGGFFVGAFEYVFGLPDWVTEEYDDAERQFGDGVCNLIREISTEVNSIVAACEAIIADADQRIAELFSSLPENLRGWATGEQARFSEQLSDLHNQVTETRDNFNHDLANRAGQAVQEVRQEIHELRLAARGLIGRVADAIDRFLEDPAKFIIEGLLELVGIPPASFWALIDRIGQVINDIADDPMNFANNLATALGQGFQKFFDNFKEHITGGFFDWLFSGLGAVGVQIPTDFSLGSLITFFLQLMGITWARIRQILARHIGEENVALIEKAYELIATLIERGPEGIFEMIREQLNPQTILSAILDAAIDYLIGALIRAVTPRIIAMFNPAGAIVQAIEVIYRILAWIFNNAARIFSLVETIVNGAADLIAGNTSGMATAVEGALARLIAPVIDFLAGFLGLGNLPDTIADTIRGLQEMVMGVIERVVAWLAQRARGLLRALGIGEEEERGVEPRPDLPTDPAERLQVALRELRPSVGRLLDAGVPENDLRRRLARWRTEFNLRELDLVEGKVIAGNSPTVDVAAVLRANVSELRRLLADIADDIMEDPRVLHEQERIIHAHQGPASIAAAGERQDDDIIPTIPAGPGPGFLGAAGALRDVNRPARWGPRSPAEYTSMPFSPSLSSEQQSVPGPGGVVVGRGEEPGSGRVSVAYPALIARYRQIAAMQTPPLTDRCMAGIVMRYVHSGVMLEPFNEGPNSVFLSDFARIVFSVEVARSQSFSVESSMILSLLQTGRLTFEQAFSRESAVNPMTMSGAPAATRAEEAAVRGTTQLPGGRVGQNAAQVSERRSELLITYALQEIEQRALTFGSADDVMDWARDFMMGLIRERAESLFGLSDQPPGPMLN